MNDFFDIEVDKLSKDPNKRPLVSGEISVLEGKFNSDDEKDVEYKKQLEKLRSELESI